MATIKKTTTPFAKALDFGFGATPVERNVIFAFRSTGVSPNRCRCLNLCNCRKGDGRNIASWFVYSASVAIEQGFRSIGSFEISFGLFVRWRRFETLFLYTQKCILKRRHRTNETKEISSDPCRTKPLFDCNARGINEPRSNVSTIEFSTVTQIQTATSVWSDPCRTKRKNDVSFDRDRSKSKIHRFCGEALTKKQMNNETKTKEKHEKRRKNETKNERKTKPRFNPGLTQV